VLTIRPTFQAAGRLTWSPELSESTVVQVSCSAVVGPHARELTRTRVRADRWGPQTIDLSGAPEYRFRLDGDGVITEERVVPAPDDGALVTVDFDVRPGHILWFRILDEAGQAVPEAEASVRWQDRGIEVSRRAVARDDGLIPVWGCPSGIVVPTFRAPGFIQVEGAPIELPFVEEGVIPVTLLRAGALRGVVVCGGKPVRDFQVVVWPERDPGRALRFTFDDTADGRFALSEIPHGDLTITATAAGFSQGVPRNVRVEPGREAEVRIEVLPVLEAIGRVVDATTGASIPGATVRVEASDGFRAIGAAGPPRRVTLDGAFRVEGVSVGRAFIEVSAPGFSSTHLSADAVAETPVDFGVVRLEPRQELVIHLRHEPSDDPTAYQVRIESPDGTSMAPFGPDAFIRVPEASAGDHRFVAFHPDGSWKVVDRHLSVGSDWYVELDASGGATLRVSALDPSGILPDEGAWVETKRMTPSGPEYRSANLDARKRVVIRHLASGHHEVVLHGHPDLGSVLLASTSVDLDDRADVEVELVVGDRDRRFRVVDDRGVPVDGVSLSIDLHDRGGSHSARGLTDSDGSCVVPSLVAGEVLVHLGHPTRGYQLGIPVRIAPPGEPTPVVFEDPVRTEVVLMRRTGPVVGAVGSLCDRQLLRAIEGPPSDELGRCVWTNVAPGEYVFAFEEEGYWPTFMPITVADGVAPVRVDLYRLCDVRVSVTRGGLPVSGAEVSMQRIGGTTPLADFVAQRLVESSTGSMRTDSEGTLRLSGVAEWEYAWNVSVPTGESREGFVEVTPVGEVLLDVEL
jgi:hypothetical protein